MKIQSYRKISSNTRIQPNLQQLLQLNLDMVTIIEGTRNGN